MRSCWTSANLLHDNGFEGEFDAVPWLYGPEGKRGVGMRAPFAALTGVVAGENAATAIQFLDFAFYSEVGQIMAASEHRSYVPAREESNSQTAAPDAQLRDDEIDWDFVGG